MKNSYIGLKETHNKNNWLNLSLVYSNTKRHCLHTPSSNKVGFDMSFGPDAFLSKTLFADANANLVLKMSHLSVASMKSSEM